MVVVFAVANRGFVQVDLWPFPIEAQAPIFLLVLGSMLLGFLLGAMVMWLSMGKQRRQTRAARGQVAKLERQTEQLEQARDRAETRGAETRSTAPATPAVDHRRGGTDLPAV